MKLEQYKPKGRYMVLKRMVNEKTKGGIYIPAAAEGELIPYFEVLKAGPECKNVIEGEIIVLGSINYLNALNFEDYPQSKQLIFTCEDSNVMGGYLPEKDS